MRSLAQSLDEPPNPVTTEPRTGLRRIKGRFRRVGLKHRDFTIISNNCFAGWIYQRFDLPYRTPTVGLFFMADDFLTLLADLPGAIGAEPEFIAPAESRYADYLSQTASSFGRYPIGLIKGTVEVQFLHYRNAAAALDNWRRRVARVNWDRLIVKFNDQNLCTEEHIRRFDALSFEHKICFTARPFQDCSSTVFLQEDEGQEHVISEKRLYNRYVPIKDYLNALP